MAITFILLGVLIVALSEAWAAFRAFRLGLTKGAFALLVPGYVLLLAKRHGYYQRFFVSWVFGIALLVLGATLISMK
jgi:hypothetical protein